MLNKKSLKTNVFKKPSLHVKDPLDAIDELPDLHDPFSELSLFLSQKIKNEMHRFPNCKKWSLKLQEELIQKITPDFQKKFPRFRLGVSAVKKTWEKISYYAHQIQHEKEALTQEGKINIHFLIKQNLRASMQLKNICPMHPYHYVHQIAVKMSECIATVDGTRPKIDALTRLIWAVQKHLIPKLPTELKTPSDPFDQMDKLIVKTILEITAKDPEISFHQLYECVKESIFQTAHCHKWPEIEQKIHTWTVQGDMICRSIQLNLDSPLVKFIRNAWENFKTKEKSSFEPFIKEVCQKYLYEHPLLISNEAALITEIRMLFKCCWYHFFTMNGESSFDRFIKWHGYILLSRFPEMDQKQILEQLEELCKKMLPLIPFDVQRAAFLLFSQEK